MARKNERQPRVCKKCLVKFHGSAYTAHVKTEHANQCPWCIAMCPAGKLHMHLLRCEGVTQEPNKIVVQGFWSCQRCGSLSHNADAHKRHRDQPHELCPCGVFALRNERKTHMLNCRRCEEAAASGSSLPEEDGDGDDSPVVDEDGSEPPEPSSSQPAQQPSTLCSDIMPAIEEYKAAAAAGLERSLDIVQHLAANAQPGRRLASDLESFQPLIQSVNVGTPITAAEYSRLLNEEKLVGPTDKFVICSMDEARTTFRPSPKLPVLIPQALSNSSSGDRLSLDTYKRLLLGKKDINVHDFNAELSAGNGPRYPTSMKPQAALDRLQRSSIDDAPVNFLDLHGYKENPVPKCFANLEEYNILRQFGWEAGKPGASVNRDLYESTVFQLLSGMGAFHLPHIDRHGVITTIFNEVGEKLWLCWPGLPVDHLPNWASDGMVPGHGVALYMQAGDTLIQPAGTLHSPFSMTTVLMTGTMHWHARSIKQILQLSRFEIENPAVTNEPPSSQFQSVVESVFREWGRDLRLRNGRESMYGSREDLQSCQERFQWFKQGCRCGAKNRSWCDSRSSKCKCRRNEQKCDGRCNCYEDCSRREFGSGAGGDTNGVDGVGENAEGDEIREEGGDANAHNCHAEEHQESVQLHRKRKRK